MCKHAWEHGQRTQSQNNTINTKKNNKLVSPYPVKKKDDT